MKPAMTLCVFLELSDTCVNQPHCPHPSGQFYICRSVPSFALFGARAAVAVRGDGLGITLVKQFRQHVPHQALARAGPAHSLQTAHAGNAVPGHRLADGQQDTTTARRTVTPGHASGSCRKGRTPQCAGADQSNAGLANKRATSTCTPTQGPSPRHPAPDARRACRSSERSAPTQTRKARTIGDNRGSKNADRSCNQTPTRSCAQSARGQLAMHAAA